MGIYAEMYVRCSTIPFNRSITGVSFLCSQIKNMAFF